MVISIDTMVAAWAVKKRATPGQESRLVMAEKFKKKLDGEGHRLILTSHVVGELLVGFSIDAAAKELLVLRKNFFIQAYDTKAAAIAARLISNTELVKWVRKETGFSRQIIKVDIAVIASAIVGNAVQLITDEKSFKALAQGEIIVKTMEEFLDDGILISGIENNPACAQNLFPDFEVD